MFPVAEHVLSGKVVHGDQRGRLLGFPTANVRIAGPRVPRFGVYAGRLDGHPAAVSVGVRPTFGSDLEPMIEAYLLDFEGDLYGRHVCVELLEFIRGEEKFDSTEALVQQIQDDVALVHGVTSARRLAAVERVERAIDELAGGAMVVLDGSAIGHGVSHLVVAGDRADERAINRMAADARGLVSLAMPASRCDRLGLLEQPAGRHDSSGRSMALSFEARHGVTTGISARDRAVTVAAAIAPNATAHDVVVPGHVFPERAADGGVVETLDTPEAAVDLMKAAGMSAAAVLCAMLDDDGEIADREAAMRYAQVRRLTAVTPGDVLAYRRNGAG